MSSMMEYQSVKAGISYISGKMDIYFEDDPSFVRSEAVLVDLDRNSVGLIFENSYHHIGAMPKNMMTGNSMDLTRARLRGLGAGGRALQMHAPVKLVGQGA
jgi:hypothetical protein